MTNKWEEINNTFLKTFEFKGFSEAINFVNKVADLANAQDHHPNMEIFSYKYVKIKLTTHCEGNKITEKDHKLREAIDKI